MAQADKSPATAIPELLERHGNQIYGLGLKMCGSPQDAEDLVQETFLQAFRKWSQFEGRSAPSTWLYRIAARLCWRSKRKRSGEPPRLDRLALLPNEDEPVVDVPAVVETADEILERVETREMVERALLALPTHFRLPLVLKEIMELSTDEAADVLGIKPATVKTRVHRARLYLGKELRDHLPKTEAPPRDHSRQMCLDLLSAKQQAMDRNVPFPVPQTELCSRCRSLFTTLDLARDACLRISRGKLPDSLRETLIQQMQTTD